MVPSGLLQFITTNNGSQARDYIQPFPFSRIIYFLFYQLKAIHIDKIFQNNLKELSPFFKDALKAWLNFQDHPPDTIQDIQTQLLWMNSNITVGDKPLLLEEFVKNGLIFVNDLLDLPGDFISYENLRNVFSISLSQLQLNQLISAIPKTWKMKLQNEKNNKLMVCLPPIRCLKWLSVWCKDK